MAIPLTLFALGGRVCAQPPNADCATAARLCAQQPVEGDNTGANLWPGFCQNTANVIWYTFTTNSRGGVVNVHVDNINCPDVLGMDEQLSLLVLSGDGSCTPGSFVPTSPCQQNDVAFSVATDSLVPNTVYWVVLAGVADGGNTIHAQCDMDITADGPGLDVLGVDFFALPSDTTIGAGSAVQLQVQGGTFWDWSPTDGLSGDNVPNPIAQPVQSTVYTVTTTISGCTYTDTVVVAVKDLINPPNTFTPNQDNFNDVWEIPGIDSYPDAEVLVFDRWGQRVFQANGYDTPWDGTVGGRRLPTATYYYTISLNQVQGLSSPYTGSITIVR
jgi:gliding motility-associated-like protein